MSRSLTIAVEGTHLPRDHRGAGRILRALLGTWKARTSQLPHRVVVVTRERHQLPALQDEMGWDFECQWIGGGIRPDVVLFTSGRVDWDVQCPRVVLVHDTSLFLPQELSPGSREADLERLAQAVRSADRVVTVSEFARRELVSNLNLPIGKVEVVMPAAGPSFTPPGADPGARARFLEEVSGGIPYLLFVGSTEPRKNLVGLLDAFAWLSNQIPHRLVLVCRRPRLSLTQRLTGRLCPIMERVRSLGNRVVFLPEVDEERLVRLYQHCDLFVMPSLHESFGLPLLEALACRAPVAAARAGSLPEIGGQAVRWFAPGEPVEMAQCMLDCLEHADALRELGPAQSAQFTWDRTAHRLLKLLEQCADRSALSQEMSA